ncbi:MAG: hypothetical protein ACI9LV_000749 [Candidatus Nanohaloarchaea archaeon]|jgi:hypothetical protein
MSRSQELPVMLDTEGLADDIEQLTNETSLNRAPREDEGFFRDILGQKGPEIAESYRKGDLDFEPEKLILRSTNPAKYGTRTNNTSQPFNSLDLEPKQDYLEIKYTIEGSLGGERWQEGLSQIADIELSKRYLDAGREFTNRLTESGYAEDIYLESLGIVPPASTENIRFEDRTYDEAAEEMTNQIENETEIKIEFQYSDPKEKGERARLVSDLILTINNTSELNGHLEKANLAEEKFGDLEGWDVPYSKQEHKEITGEVNEILTDIGFETEVSQY